MKRRNILASALSALALLVAPRDSQAQSSSDAPARGYVPDEKTAIEVGKAILIPIYGAKQIESEEPFHATLKDEVWSVTGSLTPGTAGGVATIRLSKKDAHVLSVLHTK